MSEFYIHDLLTAKTSPAKGRTQDMAKNFGVRLIDEAHLDVSGQG